MALISQQRFRAVTGALVKRLSGPNAGVPIAFPEVSAMTFQPGIEEVITEGRDRAGNRVDVSSYIDAFKPAMELTVAGTTFEMLCARLGREISTGNKTISLYRQFRVTSASKTGAAAGTGEEGNGMAADQTTSAAYVMGDGGVMTALTRIAHDTIDQAVDTQSFSQGADGAYKLTDDLIGSTVILDFPHSLTGVPQLSTTALLELEVSVSVITVGGVKILFNMPSAQIDLSQGDIELGAAESTIRVRSAFDGSSCQPVNIVYTGEAIAC